MAQENKATDYFKQTIQSYLQRRAQEDELFALRYANPKKNIDDCITFILNYVKQSGCNGFADDEIYSLAMHYYDEDDIDIGKPLTNCKVVVNHTIVLTEEEKAEARRQAMQKATDEAYRKITQGKNKTKKAETATQSSLF
ncbi:PcfK-like family protein [Barnesiella intestinihominis]|uniref:PcfK-like family protein n=1 Tax=Barnesiella intestinihominis TaxID=487174 RepID=UPI0039F4FA16